jgi:hypothetical protein
MGLNKFQYYLFSVFWKVSIPISSRSFIVSMIVEINLLIKEISSDELPLMLIVVN